MNIQERKQYREQLANFPAELKTLPNWVCYRLEYRAGQSKPTKVPYSPSKDEKAKANDPSTWIDYETCVAAVERNDYDGIGFEFGSGYVGIDLDRCRDVGTGEVQDWAQDIIAHLDSYTEASPSGSGVHIIVKGTLPPGRRREGPIEMYADARFFTVTGHHVDGTPLAVEERSGELPELHAALFPPEETSKPVPVPKPTDSTTDLLFDAEIVAKASAAANGEKFKQLWSGNWQGMYPSQSEADEALCYELAFWTGRDTVRMDGLFRQSGLYRQKWERNDYRGDTLARAVARTAETYAISKRERIEKLYAALAAGGAVRSGGTQTPAPVMAAQQSDQERQETGISTEPGPPRGFDDFRYGQNLITKQCPVAFDPAAKSAVWEAFLRDCTRGDAELQSFLRRGVGYTAYGDPREQVILMVNGPGGTGKSTFICAVMAVLGDYATTADFTTFLKKDRVGSGPSDDIANLAGARLVSSIEVDDGRQLAQALVKQLTGGDVIRARHLYQGSFEFRPQFALWLICNRAPVVAHDDDAMWRRILRLPFENKIPAAKQDKTLKARLTDVSLTGPAILAWAVRGCVEWLQSGLQVPRVVESATKSYQAQSNPLANFVAEACILHPSTFTTVADLRRAYASWVHETGERVLLGRTEFVAALRDIGCTPGTRRAGRGWVGIGLQSDAASVYGTIRNQPQTSLDALFDGETAIEAAV